MTISLTPSTTPYDLFIGGEWVPASGYGMSGVGREMGPDALHEFQENKAVIQKTGPRERVFA